MDHEHVEFEQYMDLARNLTMKKKRQICAHVRNGKSKDILMTDVGITLGEICSYLVLCDKVG